MISQEPTCVVGFWKPVTAGCPVCNGGQCTVDPEGLASDYRRWKRARNGRLLLAAAMLAALLALPLIL